MRQVTVRLAAPDASPSAAYQLISDFPRYPELTEDIREVVQHPRGADGTMISDWAVIFRNGLLCWTERDSFDPENFTVGFEQLTGDFETFRGSWRCAPAPVGNGSVITFEADFDLGIPSLAEILDPIAESTLRSIIQRTLHGLLGSVSALGSTQSEAAKTAGAVHG